MKNESFLLGIVDLKGKNWKLILLVDVLCLRINGFKWSVDYCGILIGMTLKRDWLDNTCINKGLLI